MSNPFEGTSDDAEGTPLTNLSTGVVMPPNSATCLLNAEYLGRQELESFVKKRLNLNDNGFWDP